jgi:hypothetical protein
VSVKHSFKVLREVARGATTEGRLLPQNPRAIRRQVNHMIVAEVLGQVREEGLLGERAHV